MLCLDSKLYTKEADLELCRFRRAHINLSMGTQKVWFRAPDVGLSITDIQDLRLNEPSDAVMWACLSGQQAN